MSVAVCDFNALLRNIGGLFHSPLRYSHEALRFLFILGKSFFPKLRICALHTRQLPLALTKRLEQLGIFMQPLFRPLFYMRKEGRRTPMAETVGNVMPTNGLVRDVPLPRSSAPQRLLQFS
jgi:hypothetical protein